MRQGVEMRPCGLLWGHLDECGSGGIGGECQFGDCGGDERAPASGEQEISRWRAELDVCIRGKVGAEAFALTHA